MNNSLLIRVFVHWVRFVERHSRLTLILLISLTLVAGFYAMLFGSINSDLERLIKPSESLQWNRDNEDYKRTFPILQQTAVVVVSGDSAESVDSVAKKVEVALLANATFSDVFAPGVDEYIVRHKLYFPELEDLEKWGQGARYNYGSLLRLADSAGLGNTILTFTDQASSIKGVPLPLPLTTLASGFEGDISGHKIQLEAYHRLVDPDADKFYQLIVVKGKQQHDKGLPNKQIVETLKQVTSKIATPAGVQIKHTGELVLADEELTAGMKGIGMAGTLSLILLLIILGFGVRSLTVIVSIFGLLLLGVVLTTGFATMAVGSYNALSLIFVIMFFGLGVDFAVHFVLRVREAEQSKRLSNPLLTESEDHSPAQIAITDIGAALLLCTCTSMIAFLSFVPTAYRGLGELGIISAGGMAIAFILTLTLLPALGKMLTHGGAGMTSPANRDLKVGGFNPFAVSNPKMVLGATLVATMIALYFAQGIRFDYSVLAMRDTNAEGMSTLIDLQENQQITDYSISVLADNQRAAAELKALLQVLPEVGAIDTPLDFLPTNQIDKQHLLQELHELYSSIEEVLPEEESAALLKEAILYMDESFLALQSGSSASNGLREAQGITKADEQALISKFQNLKIYLEHDANLIARNAELKQRLETELETLMSMLSAKPITIEMLPESLRTRLISEDGRYLMTVHPAEPLMARDQTQRFIEAVQKVAPNIAGRSVVEWGVGDVVVKSFIQAGAIALFAISLLLIAYFRNLRYPVMVLVPIALSLIFTFAICQLFGISLNMANILVVPLIIGLGVDTGIHVVHRYTHSATVSDVYASSTSRAVVISALTTIGTFFSLSFSPHKGAASVGLLLTISISVLVIMTFTVLPALMRVWDLRISNRLTQR
jgi:hopanoid biosynthesis associated RND transporter like protein HpnN